MRSGRTYGQATSTASISSPAWRARRRGRLTAIEDAPGRRAGHALPPLTWDGGLLRAVGTTRGQLRSMVSQESLVISLFGAIEGLVLGMLFGWAIVAALHSQGIGFWRHIPCSRR